MFNSGPFGQQQYQLPLVDNYGVRLNSANELELFGGRIHDVQYSNTYTVTNNADYPINRTAAVGTDNLNAAIYVIKFDDANQEGSGLVPVDVPLNSTQFLFEMWGRAASAPATPTGVAWSLYIRLIPNNNIAVPVSWTEYKFWFTNPATAYFSKYSVTISLTTLGMTADNLYSMALYRDTLSVNDNLVGDWHLACNRCTFI